MTRTKKDCLSDLTPEQFKKARKIANNTFKWYQDTGEKVIRLHDTNIMTFNNDNSVTLNSGGWQTITTKARINEYLPDHWGLYQEKSIWYVIQGNYWDNRNNAIPYADGITLFPNGHVTGQGEDPNKLLKLQKRIQQYCKAYVKKLTARELEQPSNGDCWGCLFTDTNGNDNVMGTDHLIQHMDEKYYVPSLLVRAIEKIPVSRICQHNIGYFFGYHNKEPFMSGDWLNKQIEKSLKRYMYQCLGLAR